MGREEWSRGSGRPSESCRFRVAARYALIVPGFRPSSARNAAKLHNNCSDTGNGESISNLVQKSLKRLAAAL